MRESNRAAERRAVGHDDALNVSSDMLRKGKHSSMMRKSAAITRDAAEAVSIQALSFIAAEPARLGAFLAASGIGPEQIRHAAREPRFLAGVLDHVAADQTLLLDFAAEAGLDARHVMAARDVLAGHSWERDAP